MHKSRAEVNQPPDKLKHNFWIKDNAKHLITELGDQTLDFQNTDFSFPSVHSTNYNHKPAVELDSDSLQWKF